MDKKVKTNQKVYISYNISDSSVSSFISHLVAALYRLGIVALSEKVRDKLESNRFSNIKLFLVVVSNSYSSSVACLENLVKLLVFLHKEGHVVVPVFYDAVMKRDMEMFGEAFSELENSHSADHVTNWRRALAKTMKLRGHGYTDKLRYASELIEVIAKDVVERVYPTAPIGIDKALQELQNLLCKQAWDIRSIGIFGEPGIGKTTVTNASFCRMSCDFDDSRFIKESNEKIFEFFSDDDFQEIEMEKFDRNNQDAEPFYRRKRFLFALDNVRNAQHAKALLRRFERFGPGSLIIIISRDRQVLEECHVNEIYEVKGLNDEDALKLFRRCFFGEEEKLPELSVRELERFGGNPSTIRSYAEMTKSKKTIEMDPDLGRIFQDWLTYNYKKKLFSCFQGTEDRFLINLKQSFLITAAAHNYQSDTEKLLGLDLTSRFTESIFREQNSFFCASSHNDKSDLKDLPRLDCPSRSLESLPSDRMIFSRAQQFQRRQLFLLKRLTCQLFKLWGGNKSFSWLRSINFGHFEKLVEIEAISEAHNLEEIDLRDCISLERIPVTDQLKHLQILNLSGCTGIEHFPDNIRTIPELNLEGTGIMEIRCEENGFSKLAKQQSTTTLLLTGRP